MDKFVIKKRKHGDSGEGEEGNESRSTSEKDLAISTANKSTSKKSKKNRSYLDNYLDLGFFWCGDEVNPTPLCVICGDKLANEAMVPSKLKRHLSLKHGHLANKPRSYFEGLLNEQKQQRVMLSKTVKVSDKAQEASYLVAELVAKSMKPHTIAETLILPACSAIVKTMFGSEAEKQVKKIPVSDSTISRRIHDMSADIEETVCASVKESEMFALQVDESTDIGGKMDEPIVINNFIGGVMVPCQDHIDSHDPSTGLVWAKIPDSGQAEVDAAVNAAQAAFEGWSCKSAQTRANHLLKVADILESRLEEFAVAESRDQGKPVWLARIIDIPRCVLNLRHFAHAIPHHLNTSNVNPEMGVVNYTLREPQGVAGLISPWNLPLYLLTFKLAPALMCGNTVVAKPSEMTSVTAYMFCKVLQDADFPAGVVNMVFGRGPSAGQALITHPQVPLVSFTGSTLTGKFIAQATAPMFKKLSLEMGGKNAAVVFDDCDMESCIATLKRSSFINSGQVCLCTSRIFVQKSLFKDFLEKFTAVAREVKIGPPSDKDVFMGPLNSKPHLEKVLRYISYAVEDGGQVLCGHGVEILDLPPQNKEGYFMRPTIITGLSDKSRCMQEEIFGPITCVTPFDTEEEVITRVNDTPYGLCASVFTSNLARGHRVAHKLKAGTVWTNCWLVRDLDMPFGGVKKSGLGRESTQDSLEFYTEAKTVCIKI